MDEGIPIISSFTRPAARFAEFEALPQLYRVMPAVSKLRWDRIGE